jgi:hypothetical protein
MHSYELCHLADDTLTRAVNAVDSRDLTTTAEWLAYIAEFDARRLYRPAGYSSMFAYCVGHLRRPDDSARKRIHAARTARRFPAIFEAVADGRLQLSTVVMLAPHLTEANATDLIGAASHKSKSEIERILKGRIDHSDVPGEVLEFAPPGEPAAERAPGRVEQDLELIPQRMGDPRSPGTGESPSTSARLGSPGSQRYPVRFMIDQQIKDDLQRVREIFSHAVPTGDIATLFGRALKALIREGEKRKFGATDRPRANSRPSATRYIPAHVRRAVRERDGDRCTFVSDTSHRCEERKFLEFDHSEPVARGGTSTVANVRLRCRAHNQYAAERAFGAEFMRRKREEAQAREAVERAHSEVLPWLRQLGFRANEARRAIEISGADPKSSLKERVRLALRHLAPPRVRLPGDARECAAASSAAAP